MRLISCVFFCAISGQVLVEANSFDFGQFFGLKDPEEKTLVRTERVEDPNTPDNERKLVSEPYNPRAAEEAGDSQSPYSSSSDLQFDNYNSSMSSPDDELINTSEETTNELSQLESKESTYLIDSSTTDIQNTATNEILTSDLEISSTEKSKELSNDDQEQVILGTAQTTTVPETLLQKTVDWMKDAYTLSILIPVAAGILFACSIILTISICKCCRRCCRRRRFKRNTLPDSVKNLRPSDRARLLGESSDDEF